MKQELDENRRVIREEEPQKPSTFVSPMELNVRTNVAQHRQSDSAKLIGQIPGDLDWIVMEALERKGVDVGKKNPLAQEVGGREPAPTSPFSSS